MGCDIFVALFPKWTANHVVVVVIKMPTVIKLIIINKGRGLLVSSEDYK